MEIEKGNYDEGYGETLLAVSALTWSVTLQVFTIDSEIPFNLFILTRGTSKQKYSELYYFQHTAEEAFFRLVLEYEKMEFKKMLF